MYNKIKVSVIMPVYNVEKYLRETLDSVVNQTLDDYEIIVIDDESTDGSRNIIEDYCKKYNNIKAIYQKNKGPSATRNRGIKMAEGEYIVFVDSDDIIPNDSLEVRYKLAKEQKADIVVTMTHMFNETDEWPIKSHFLDEGPKNIITNHELLWMMGPCNKIYKRDIIKDIEFPIGINYGEDQVFVLKAYFRSRKIYSTQYVGYYYRRRESEGESLTQQLFIKPDYVLNNSSKCWKLIANEIDKNIENKYNKWALEKSYLERLISVDVWPSFKQAIISKNENMQISAFQTMEYLIDNIDNYVFNQIKKLIWILTSGVIQKYLFLTKKSKKFYIKLLIKTYKKMDYYNRSILETYHRCLYKYIEKAVLRDNYKYIYIYLIKNNLSNKVKVFKKRLDVSSDRIFYRFSKILPNKKNKVVLASNKSKELTGNLKYIYDELVSRDEFIIKIYMNNKRDKINRLKMYYNFATSKFILIDDYYRQLYGLKIRKGSELIQVWHACGAFKKFGFSAIGKSDGNSLEFEKKAHLHYSKVLTSSKEVNKYYSEAFNINKENILSFGVPRTDILLNKEYQEFIKLNLESLYPIIKNKNVITYAPTFRGGIEARKNFKLQLDLERILKELGNDYVIILKLHPSVNYECIDLSNMPNDYKNRILNINSDFDINKILLVTDILISDYSSVIFEAALLNKKILMYAYDKDEYLSERDFYYNYDNFVPGPIAYNNEDVINIIKENKFDMEKVKSFKNKFFNLEAGSATKKLVDYISERSK